MMHPSLQTMQIDIQNMYFESMTAVTGTIRLLICVWKLPASEVGTLLLDFLLLLLVELVIAVDDAFFLQFV